MAKSKASIRVASSRSRGSAWFGRVADEVRALAAVGVPAHDALGAASWTARRYLGLPGLEPGAPADAVIYDTDPRRDLDQLTRPRAVILRGTVCARR